MTVMMPMMFDPTPCCLHIAHAIVHRIPAEMRVAEDVDLRLKLLPGVQGVEFRSLGAVFRLFVADVVWGAVLIRHEAATSV